MDSIFESSHASLLVGLRETLSIQVSQSLSGVRSRRFAILDRPNYSNVGDHAIWLGSLALLGKLGYRCVYSPSIRSTEWHLLERVVDGGGFIVLAGGGNFGDLWPRHQLYREEVLSRFPEADIVQFPQSVHFSSDAAIERARGVLQGHRSLTLLVRDRASAAFLKEAMDVEANLCPDAAFALDLPRPANTQSGPVVLLRSDHEALVAPPEQAGPYPVIDWLAASQPKRFSVAGLSLSLERRLTAHSSAALKMRGRLEDRGSVYQLRRGIAILSRGESVITDRLHAHILCFLMSIPHAVLDNSYGKVHGFIDQWTESSPLVKKSHSLAEALTSLK